MQSRKISEISLEVRSLHTGLGSTEVMAVLAKDLLPDDYGMAVCGLYAFFEV
jgi:hypothetical protein